MMNHEEQRERSIKLKTRGLTSIDEMVEAKRRGGEIKKLHPSGLTVEERGHVYTINGYEVFVEEDPDEIMRRLREVS